VATSIAVNYFN